MGAFGAGREFGGVLGIVLVVGDASVASAQRHLPAIQSELANETALVFSKYEIRVFAVDHLPLLLDQFVFDLVLYPSPARSHADQTISSAFAVGFSCRLHCGSRSMPLVVTPSARFRDRLGSVLSGLEFHRILPIMWQVVLLL